MAFGRKKKKDKKAKINKIERPAPKAVPEKASKVVKTKRSAVLPQDNVYEKAPKAVKSDGSLIQIHMLANALVEDMQYTKDEDYTVTVRVFKQIGKSCITLKEWAAYKAKHGLSSVRK